MEQAWTNRAEPVKRASRNAAGTPLLWGAVIGFIVVAHLALTGERIRLDMLRAVLILAAVGETIGGCFAIFRPRWFAERNGRPYDPAYHGVSQDFGFYNIAVASLFALAALNPTRSTAVLGVAIALYAVHGITHVFRYFGIYYGGGTPIATRPQQAELRDALTLLAAATGLVLFFP